MAKTGTPFESITVAAGVPTPEKATELMDQVRAAGLGYVAFKPGSIDSIYDTIAVANEHPDIVVMLQWTGGRGGGHHSFEDMHEPILETYGAIRRCPNIVLLCGSGFGDAKVRHARSHARSLALIFPVLLDTTFIYRFSHTCA